MTAYQTKNSELGILKLGCFWGPFLGPQNHRKNEVDQLGLDSTLKLLCKRGVAMQEVGECKIEAY
jgi:hypothetical protein